MPAPKRPNMTAKQLAIASHELRKRGHSSETAGRILYSYLQGLPKVAPPTVNELEALADIAFGPVAQ